MYEIIGLSASVIALLFHFYMEWRIKKYKKQIAFCEKQEIKAKRNGGIVLYPSGEIYYRNTVKVEWKDRTK